MGFFFVISFNQSFFFSLSLSRQPAFALLRRLCLYGLFSSTLAFFCALRSYSSEKKKKTDKFRLFSMFLDYRRCLYARLSYKKRAFLLQPAVQAPWTRLSAPAIHPSRPFLPADAVVVNTERTLLYIPVSMNFIFVVLRLLLGPPFFCSNFTFAPNDFFA